MVHRAAVIKYVFVSLVYLILSNAIFGTHNSSHSGWHDPNVLGCQILHLLIVMPDTNESLYELDTISYVYSIDFTLYSIQQPFYRIQIWTISWPWKDCQSGFFQVPHDLSRAVAWHTILHENSIAVCIPLEHLG